MSLRDKVKALLPDPKAAPLIPPQPVPGGPDDDDPEDVSAAASQSQNLEPIAETGQPTAPPQNKTSEVAKAAQVAAEVAARNSTCAAALFQEAGFAGGLDDGTAVMGFIYGALMRFPDGSVRVRSFFNVPEGLNGRLQMYDITHEMLTTSLRRQGGGE